ncbi:RING finger protein 11 [Dirofilaria immitis]|nr:RING finger protein 11 [Dirofilaria immitis]
MGEQINMGNCLPLLFPNLLRSDDRSPLEEVIDTTASNNNIRRPDSESQSAYMNELWISEANNERRRRELLMEDPKKRICPICMVDFVDGDPIRYLPCMHCYHKKCVDDWLMRSFSCPSCMEPVDSAMLSSFAAHTLSGLEALACSPATSSVHHNLPPS